MLLKSTRRRAHVRHAPSQPDGCQVFLRSREEQSGGIVKNLSTHGIGVVVPRCVAPGTELTVQITNASKLFCIDLEMRVVHASALPNGAYLIGCEFTSPLSHETVQALVR